MTGHQFDAKYDGEKLSKTIYSARTSCFTFLQKCNAKLLLFLIQILPKPYLNFKSVQQNSLRRRNKNNVCACNYTIMTHPVHAIQGLKIVLTTNGDAYDQETYRLNVSYCPVSKKCFGFLSQFIPYMISV